MFRRHLGEQSWRLKSGDGIYQQQGWPQQFSHPFDYYFAYTIASRLYSGRVGLSTVLRVFE